MKIRKSRAGKSAENLKFIIEIFLPINFLVSDDKKSENFKNLYIVLCPLLIHRFHFNALTISIFVFIKQEEEKVPNNF